MQSLIIPTKLSTSSSQVVLCNGSKAQTVDALIAGGFGGSHRGRSWLGRSTQRGVA